MVLEVVLVVLEVVLQLVLLQLLLLQLRVLLSGIVIRVHICWNLGWPVPGTLGSHKYQTKTPGSHHLGPQFGHKISSN